MKKLTNATFTDITGRTRAALPVRVLQFGEGNFLRAFVDQMLDVANEKTGLGMGVAVVQPIERGLVPMLNEQDGLYTLLLRGIVHGETVEDKRVISVIQQSIDPYVDFDALKSLAVDPNVRFVVSNTTEAGITYTGMDNLGDQPAKSFPAKVTQLLFARYNALGGAKESALIFLPCELIDANGDMLLDCVLKNAAQWQLPADFVRWVREDNVFSNTLVDRIVPGYPRNDAQALQTAWGYEDSLIDTAEPFGLWVIEGPAWLADELPLDKAGLPVIFTDDVKPYKLRKVRMLNGAHTMMVTAAYLMGLDTVGQCMADADVRAFMLEGLTQEIMPTLDLPREDLQAFADAMLERFANPFNPHYLLSITLNCVSKWRARVLPSVLAYLERKGELPWRLTFSLAALIAFYRGKKVAEGQMEGQPAGVVYTVQDDAAVVDFFAALPAGSARDTAERVCANEAFWGMDLCKVPGLLDAVANALQDIDAMGTRAAIQKRM